MIKSFLASFDISDLMKITVTEIVLHLQIPHKLYIFSNSIYY